jgi:hypothetical protein
MLGIWDFKNSVNGYDIRWDQERAQAHVLIHHRVLAYNNTFDKVRPGVSKKHDENNDKGVNT